MDKVIALLIVSLATFSTVVVQREDLAFDLTIKSTVPYPTGVFH